MFKILTFPGEAGYNEAAGSIRFDGIQLAADNTATVERDAEGVPVAWRLLKLGKNELTWDGRRIDLALSADHLDTIINYYTEKGVRIPIDSRHFLSRFADSKGVDESEVLKLVPCGQLAMGFGCLQARADGLWITDVEFNPLAREMVRGKSFLYYSPVIRGLADGRLRITSVAMENEPAINNQDALAASADQRDEQAFKQPKEKKHMKLCKALAGLLGMDSVALSADGDAPEDVVSKINNLATEVPGLRKSKTDNDSFLAKIKDSLALGADADESTIQGTILGLKAKADSADPLKVRVDALELAAENEKRDKLIESGRTAGKLADSQLEWAKTLDSMALSAYLEKAPVVIPLDRVKRKDIQEGDSVALSAEDRQVCKLTGTSEADFLAAKKANKQ